jgi:hypothetical protein
MKVENEVFKKLEQVYNDAKLSAYVTNDGSQIVHEEPVV